MTKWEAYENLKDYLDHVFHNSNDYETYCYLRDCADTLAPPAPDPITGLVPCGCGGQAVFEGSFLDEEVPSSYGVSLSCIECGISTIAYEYEQEAMKAWNTGMGYTPPGAIGLEPDRTAPNGDKGATHG